MSRVLLFGLCFLVCLSFATSAPVRYSGSQQLSPFYWLAWEIVPSTGPLPPIITFTATVNATCWIGLGFHEYNTSNKAMTKADFIMAEFDGSTGRIRNVTDRFASSQNGGFALPALDVDIGGEDNILGFSGYQTNSPVSLSTFTASRFVKTGDSEADHTIVPGPLQVIWAHGNTVASDPNQLAYHGFGSNNRGIAFIDFFANQK